MQKLLLIEMPVDALEGLIIDCVNVCLKNHMPQQPTPAPQPDAAQMLTKKEAARLIGVSPGTIDNAARAGKLERRYVGKAVRFLRSEVLSLPEGKAQRKPGTPLLNRSKRKA